MGIISRIKESIRRYKAYKKLHADKREKEFHAKLERALGRRTYFFVFGNKKSKRK